MEMNRYKYNNSFILLLLVLLSGCAATSEKQRQVQTNDESHRVELAGFSLIPPKIDGWRVVKQSKTELVFFGTPQESEHGKRSSAASGGIYKAGDYSRDAETFYRQINSVFAEDNKNPRYTDLKYKSKLIKQDGADCVFSARSSGDSEMLSANGEPYSLNIDELLCLHPHDERFIVKLNVMQRVPSGGQPEDLAGVMERMFGSLKFSE